MARKKSPFVYFKRLALTNVKAFGQTQELDLTDPETGRPSKWTLILGDNGVGKTTLLQCIALMRPFLTTRQGTSSDSPEPDHVQPALAQRDDTELAALARVGVTAGVRIEAELIAGQRLSGPGGRPVPLKLSADIGVRAGKLDQFETSDLRIDGFTEPLVIGYSAARHMSYRGSDTQRISSDPTEALFDASIELTDPEEVLQRLDYATYKNNTKAAALLARLKDALASLLPDIQAGESIRIYGPPTPADEGGKSGVHAITPYGEVPLRSLSLGYQTVTAWTLDLAWRLFEHYAEEDDPLQQPAVVLVDEIDLHLHPLWQRSIRPHLGEFFPQVQFILTAHSPLMAQNYFDSNIVVLSQTEGYVEIDNDPPIVPTWGLDETVTSDLFGLNSPYPPAVDAMITERKRLLSQARKSQEDWARIEELQKSIEAATRDDPDIRACVAP